MEELILIVTQSFRSKRMNIDQVLPSNEYFPVNPASDQQEMPVLLLVFDIAEQQVIAHWHQDQSNTAFMLVPSNDLIFTIKVY